MLNDPLAPIAARQIEIDVGPLAALLGQKALEQQIHADRIDRRDPEAVADGAVGRRPAALDEDVLGAAEIDDVPDDEEVAGEVQLVDEIELAGDLRARPIVKRPVPLPRAHLGDLPEKRGLGLARRHRILGKPIAQIRHRVLQAIGELARARHRLRQIAEERRHVGRRLEIPLRVRRKAPARARQIRVVMDAREHVEQRAPGRRREAHAVGGDDRHAKGRRQIDERAVVGFLVPVEMTLQLHVHAMPAEQSDEAIEQPADAVAAAVERGAADERDEPARAPVQLLQRERAFALRRAELHAGDEAAQVAVPVLAFAENGQEKLENLELE